MSEACAHFSPIQLPFCGWLFPNLSSTRSCERRSPVFETERLGGCFSPMLLLSRS